MDNLVCANCGSRNFSSVRTYKHDWYQCNDCRTVQRQRRPSCLFDVAPVRALIMGTKLKIIFGRSLLREREVVQEESKFYDLYDAAAAAGAEGTKWKPLTPFRLNDFAENGIDIAGKSVLEISGGPGFLAQAMQSAGARVVETEYSKIAADGMGKALGIDSVKFDYNSDEIARCVKGPFDVVLIIYSIGFCNDLRAFVRSLKNVLHDKSVIYVCHSPGTLGLMLRWQFDEYTYTRCWEPETLAKCFAEIGFPESLRVDEGSYAYDRNWYNSSGSRIGGFLRRFHRLIGRYYRWCALRPYSSFNRELVQKNIKQIFRR